MKYNSIETAIIGGLGRLGGAISDDMLEVSLGVCGSVVRDVSVVMVEPLSEKVRNDGEAVDEPARVVPSSGSILRSCFLRLLRAVLCDELELDELDDDGKDPNESDDKESESESDFDSCLLFGSPSTFSTYEGIEYSSSFSC